MGVTIRIGKTAPGTKIIKGPVTINGDQVLNFKTFETPRRRKKVAKPTGGTTVFGQVVGQKIVKGRIINIP